MTMPLAFQKQRNKPDASQSATFQAAICQWQKNEYFPKRCNWLKYYNNNNDKLYLLTMLQSA